MTKIENVQAIIRKKINDQFNLQVETIKAGSYTEWETAVYKMARLRELETRLTLIDVQIKSLSLEVDEIAHQIDQI